MEYTLQAVKYNNYYDRILKVGKTPHDYELDDEHPYFEYGVYFNFGDGIMTTQVVNNSVEDKDYVILIDENEEVHSRWFIIESKYQLNGQQILTLLRDVVAEHYKTALYSTAFIEKGWLQARNKLIYNKENMTFNQVKKDEILLKDGTGIPWIVGYYPNSAEIKGTAKIGNQDFDEYIDSNFADWQYYSLFNIGVMKGDPKDQIFKTYNIGETSPAYGTNSLKTTARQSQDGIVVTTEYNQNIPEGIALAAAYPTYSNVEFQLKVTNSYINNYDDYCSLLFNELGLDAKQVEAVTALDGKRIKFKDGIKTFHVKNSGYVGSTFYNAVSGLSINDRIIKDYKSAGITIKTTVGKSWIRVDYSYDTYTCSYDVSQSGEYAYSIGQNHYTLSDAPYSMFCMPYGALTVMEGENSIITDKDIQMAVATSMAEASGNVYDIQILPYCPIGEINSNQYTVTDSRAYDVIKIGETTAGYIFHCQRSSFSKRLSLLPLPTWLTRRSDPVDVKVQNECEFIRFNSPNYASSWEMSVAKNEGVSWVNVSATYLPYNPYIKVYPDIKGLYGDDFNDNRGLILSGDFSIPVITDQWKTYQLQNKNYEAMFNREIKALDIQQKYGRLQDIVGATTGAIGAAGTGVALGSAAGPAGMAIGAAAGAVAGIATGIGDIAINDALRDEAKNYKKDMYGYQLGNIQALPNTLSKTTAYTIDNKYFPFIEHYSATPVEVSAFKEKLRYNGMTVGVIGKVADYILSESGTLTYVKAQLIRVYSIGDMHLANQLASEMAKGVYVNGSITART